MTQGGERREPKRYIPSITLGNILTIIGMIAACAGFFMRYNDRLLMVEASQVSASQRDTEFRREVMQRLSDLQVDVREIRSAQGVRWRELPPSRYQQ